MARELSERRRYLATRSRGAGMLTGAKYSASHIVVYDQRCSQYAVTALLRLAQVTFPLI